MDTQTLQTFMKLAEYRNFTKTADALFIAQSTVTSRIAELEKEIDMQLFERNKRKVMLTPEGEVFLNYARRILELSDTGIREIHSLGNQREILRLGTTNTIYECHLFPRIKKYMTACPEDVIKITIGHSKDLLQEIQDGLYDVVYSYLPMNKSGFVCELFAEDELVLVTRAENQRYNNGILQENLVESEYLYCNFALQEVGLSIRELFPPYYQFRFEINNSTKLIPYLLAFDGISFLPQSIVKPYLAGGQLKEIKLIDFETPRINCYKLYRMGNEKVQRL